MVPVPPSAPPECTSTEPAPSVLSTSNVPPFTAVLPVYPFVPDSVSVPVPTLTREPPTPSISPLTSVERLLEPTVSSFEPRLYVPSPAIEPAVIPGTISGGAPLSGKVPRPEISKVPPALVMKAALPPVLLPKKLVVPPLWVGIVALPPLLPWKKLTIPLLVIVALPAVLVPPVKKAGEKLSSALPGSILLVA